MPFPRGGGGNDDQQTFNPLVEALTFWDISERPKTNDPEKKLGRGMGAIGQAVVTAEGKWPVVFSDFAEKSVVSRRILDSDHWALRIHDELGRGKLSHWVPRHVVDHRHKHDEREHRSTMVLDQSENQFWAWRADLEWIVALGASTTHAELKFNGAGFLDLLYDGKGGAGSRGALSANIARNAGFLTDGAAVGQWWHVISPVFKSGTVAKDEPPSLQTETTLRSDVYYNTGKRRWMLNPKGDTLTVDERGAKVAIGQMFLVPPWDPSTKPLIEDEEKVKPVLDPNSNQPTLPRGESWKTKVYVLYDQPSVPPKHQYPPTQTTPGGHTPNPYATPTPTGEGSGLQPVPTVDTTHGPTSQAHCFLPGEFSGIMVKFPIPANVGSATSPTWMEITMEFSVRAAHTGVQTSDVSFMYRAVAQGATPGAYTQVDKSFAVADGLAAGKWTHCRLTIPRSALVGTESGILELWTFMRSSSTGPQLILGEFHAAYQNYGTAPAGGFAIV